MFGCKCFSWSRVNHLTESRSEYFSLPEPIPRWPKGTSFATKSIKLGELEVCQITRFDIIWSCNLSVEKNQFVSFYKPIRIPEGFFCLGHYCQSNEKPLRGYVLVARELVNQPHSRMLGHNHKPALADPADYSLIWSSADGADENFDGCGYFWLPQPPEGYKALGFIVTSTPGKPNPEVVKCVRSDLTDTCGTCRLIADLHDKLSKAPLVILSTRPLHRGMYERGVSVGTFYCSSNSHSQEELSIACLKNLDPNLQAMPNMDQIHALVCHYGPTVFFHPDEIYLPSSVSWFFRNGALLFSRSGSVGHAIDDDGSNLPKGGTNDGDYWIDLPSDVGRENVKHGSLVSARLYLHIKPALGGTFTDIAFWIFCPFNGPGTLKVGMMNFSLSKVGQHVGDWEHFTLRISNFTGELWSIYFSQHSGGEWVEACDLEFVQGNKAAVYSSRNGHASFPRTGNHIQGSQKLGIGVRNDAARSDRYVDSSKQYDIVAAEYLGNGVVIEPCWLQYMREWGPTVVYDSRAELDKIVKVLPLVIKSPVENVLNKLPLELYREEGPTGPKEKNNWIRDERW